MTFLIDTHCHLNMQPFSDDLDAVIQNATNTGVKYLHTICTTINELPEILSIAEKNKNIYCSVGIHPCNVVVDNILPSNKLSELSKHPKIISFGETGLDYYHDTREVKAQKESFINHIIASSQEKLPIIVHTRDAEDDTIEILTTEMRNSPYTGVIHCFTASELFARKALDLGLYISVAGIITFKNAIALQEIISKLPLDRLLIETDAPYLAPTPHRGKRNEPAFIKHTAEFLASLHNKSVSEIMNVTTTNAKKIFTKASFI